MDQGNVKDDDLAESDAWVVDATDRKGLPEKESLKPKWSEEGKHKQITWNCNQENQ